MKHILREILLFLIMIAAILLGEGGGNHVMTCF